LGELFYVLFLYPTPDPSPKRGGENNGWYAHPTRFSRHLINNTCPKEGVQTIRSAEGVNPVFKYNGASINPLIIYTTAISFRAARVVTNNLGDADEEKEPR
jgi:hypothetical protein